MFLFKAVESAKYKAKEIAKLAKKVGETNNAPSKPLLKNGDPAEILKNLHIERESLYEEVSDYTVNTENKSSQEVSSEIIKLVKNYG